MPDLVPVSNDATDLQDMPLEQGGVYLFTGLVERSALCQGQTTEKASGTGGRPHFITRLLPIHHKIITRCYISSLSDAPHCHWTAQ